MKTGDGEGERVNATRTQDRETSTHCGVPRWLAIAAPSCGCVAVPEADRGRLRGT